MKTITHPIFIVLATIYAVYYGLKQTDVVFPLFISNYLADLLSIFLVNTFTLWCIRKIKNRPYLELPIPLILMSVVMFSIFFEFVLPQKSSIYIYDPWDVLCYFISGMAYIFWRWK
ncbi:hypothetical protein [Brumimicrobium mesophilum]|uniref:hypothetical protein n=1 Tax=Brumimicrobium mesophilum TaxID=392717 RepID=UPI000D143C1E|nr:hypothetical protein [Brumimicrobium mesophilum]